jgi:hypothetical protein
MLDVFSKFTEVDKSIYNAFSIVEKIKDDFHRVDKNGRVQEQRIRSIESAVVEVTETLGVLKNHSERMT